MGKFLKVLLTVGVLGGAGFGWVMHATSALTDTADAFFQALKSQNVGKARWHLAKETNDKLDQGALERVMKNESIAAYQEASFPNRRISGERGELSGTFTTTAGGVVPVTMVLVQEGGAWKVFAFQTAK